MQKIIGFIMILLLVQLSLAIETEINIKAKPSTLVYVIILHNEGPNTGKIISNQSNYRLTSNAQGLVSLKYNLDKESTLQVSAKSSDMESFIIYKDIPNGKSAFLDLTNPLTPAFITSKASNPQQSPAPSPSVSQTNTSSPVQIVPAESNQNQSQVSDPKQSFSIFDSIILKIIVYAIVALFFISLIIFIIVSVINALRIRKSEHGSIKTIKFSEKFHSPYPHLKDIKEAERKLFEAQDEINKLKNKEKEIKDIEKRIRDDESRLKRLRGY